MKLSDFELDVMQYFWDQPQASAKEIHEKVSVYKPVAYNTLKTIVDRLEEKKAIRRIGKDGRSIIFEAAISREALTPSVLPNFVKRFFGGKPSNLITHLVDDDQLSDSDIEYLQAYIDKKKAQKD